MRVLLLGAGFSRNWDGWLAPEAFEYLIGCPHVRSNPRLQALLWRHQATGGFEDALGDIQSAFSREPAANRRELEALQSAVTGMFAEMNQAFFKTRFEFQERHIERTVVEFLGRFDRIFTLNQDLLLERHYLSAGLRAHYSRSWESQYLPGMRRIPLTQEPHLAWSEDEWIPADTADFAR